MERAVRLTKLRIAMMITLFLLAFLAIILVGVITTNWLWAFLILAIYFLVTALVAGQLKETINRMFRVTHFLLSCECRAQNNRVYLKHGIELRPGFLGKWVEFTAFKERSRKKYLYFVEERVRNQDLS